MSCIWAKGFSFSFWVVFWTIVAVQWPSHRLHHRRLFFYPLTGTEHGSQPSLTSHDRELVSVLEVRIDLGDLNLRPLIPQSVTLPTLPQAGWLYVDDCVCVCVCVLSDLTWLPLLGGGRKSWYNIIIIIIIIDPLHIADSPLGNFSYLWVCSVHPGDNI